MNILPINADSPARRQRSLWLGLVFVLALLMLQQWGLVHRYVHGGLRLGAVNTEVVTREGGDDEAAEASRAFPNHEKPVCLVFDQLCMGDAAPCMVTLTSLMAMMALPFQHSTWAFIARWAALFQARGPPIQSL